MDSFKLLFYLVTTSMSVIVIQCEDKDQTKLSKSANCFTLRLYKNLPQDKDNIISSPFSADVVLSMLLAGAGGKTAQELSQALRYQDTNLAVPSMAKAFRGSLDLLNGKDGSVLNIINSVWIQDGIQVQPDYLNSVNEDFLAKEESADFRKDAKGATAAINNWVKNKTEGLITKLFDKDLDTDTIMVLVNAIYNKGKWVKKFDPHSTWKTPFYNSGDQSIKKMVPFMRQTETFKYKHDKKLNAQVLEMDYVGGETSMVILLPDINSSISSLEKSLTCEDFRDGYRTTNTTRVGLQMPKFEVESSFNLRDSLQKLNINEVFDPSSSNLTGMSSSNKLFLSIIVQKAVIKVYEEGSEAAAATGGGANGSGVPVKNTEFKADRPFLYFIRHNPTNLILFIGRIKSF